MNIKCIKCEGITKVHKKNLSKTNVYFIVKHNIYICRKCKEIIIGQKLKEYINQKS